VWPQFGWNIASSDSIQTTTGCQCGSASTSKWRSLPTRCRRRRRRRIWIRCCTDTSAHVPYGRPTRRDSSSREHALNSLDTLFCVCAPSVWNDLSDNIRLCETVPTIKKHLKTHYFSRAFMSLYLSTDLMALCVWISMCICICVHFIYIFVSCIMYSVTQMRLTFV